jgi:PKD domain
MRLMLLLAVTAFVAALAPATAGAVTTPNFNFKHGETNGRTGATVSGGGERECLSDALCTYEMHEFTIQPHEQNGKFSIQITWTGIPGQNGSDTQDDYDLYVYRVATDPEGEEIEVQVASGATGGTEQETASLLSSVNAPIPAGKYRIYVDNFKVRPDNQEWQGYAAFEPFEIVNLLPSAALTGPAQATAGELVTLDASGSADPDGRVENYAWDLDGNGLFDVDGPSPTQQARFATGGRKHVSVRIRDDRNGFDFATHTINVAPPTGETRFVEVEPPPGAISVDVARRQSLAQVALRGVAATVACPTACEILGSLRVSRATARRLGVARTLSNRRRELSGEGSTPRLRLKPGRRAMRRIRRSGRSVTATVVITVTADGYAPRTFVRRVTITR